LVKWEKQSQFKANTKPIQTQFKPNSKPIQTQYKPNLSCRSSGEAGTNPTCRGVASGEAGSNPIYRYVASGEAGSNPTYRYVASGEGGTNPISKAEACPPSVWGANSKPCLPRCLAGLVRHQCGGIKVKMKLTNLLTNSYEQRTNNYELIQPILIFRHKGLTLPYKSLR